MLRSGGKSIIDFQVCMFLSKVLLRIFLNSSDNFGVKRTEKFPFLLVSHSTRIYQLRSDGKNNLQKVQADIVHHIL